MKWIVIIETAVIVILCFVLFKCCNTPVTSDHRIEDSILKVSILKDSTYKSNHTILLIRFDSAYGKAGFWENQFRKSNIQVKGVNLKVEEFKTEIERLRSSGNIDSAYKALDEAKAAYLDLVDLMNDISRNADSTINAQDTALQRAKDLLSLTGTQIMDLTSQRDGYKLDLKSKDSTIDKLQAKRKANNLWAKISTVWATIATIISIVKK